MKSIKIKPKIVFACQLSLSVFSFLLSVHAVAQSLEWHDYLSFGTHYDTATDTACVSNGEEFKTLAVCEEPPGGYFVVGQGAKNENYTKPTNINADLKDCFLSRDYDDDIANNVTPLVFNESCFGDSDPSDPFVGSLCCGGVDQCRKISEGRFTCDSGNTNPCESVGVLSVNPDKVNNQDTTDLTPDGIGDPTTICAGCNVVSFMMSGANVYRCLPECQDRYFDTTAPTGSDCAGCSVVSKSIDGTTYYQCE